MPDNDYPQKRLTIAPGEIYTLQFDVPPDERLLDNGSNGYGAFYTIRPAGSTDLNDKDNRYLTLYLKKSPSSTIDAKLFWLLSSVSGGLWLVAFIWLFFG